MLGDVQIESQKVDDRSLNGIGSLLTLWTLKPPAQEFDANLTSSLDLTDRLELRVVP